ncbi:MAG: CCA tRNA nucleotidyltransferase [Lachnospiraceae bacterium]|nr:CCA tRNA nucleotidyltransferase [Lachnospiraceae bacterium]
MKISLPSDVNFIIDMITKAGYEAFAVGGCIRDAILGRIPEDYDITTSATPEEIKTIFKKTIDTGIEHGTVTVMLKGVGYEVTTYRIDGKYEDARHPSSVSYTKSLREDLLRRDFTINAMAYNAKDGLVDPFGGQDDIKRKLIRCVGVPYERFSEDALRIMRAVRFSSQLGYEIDEDTKTAMKELSGNLSKISEERIQVELVKLVCSDHPENMRVMYETGITKVILPEFDAMMETPQNHPHHIYSVGEHTIKSMEEIEKDKMLRLAMLFHDIGKPKVRTKDEKGFDHFHSHPEVSFEMTKDILRRLKFDNDTINCVSKLVGFHDKLIEPNEKAVRRAMNEVGEIIFPLLLMVKKADVMAQSDYKRHEKLQRLATLWSLYTKICENNQCTNLKELKIKGQDLIKIGYKAGPGLGEELKRLLDKVIDDPSLNNQDTLIKLAMEDLR